MIQLRTLGALELTSSAGTSLETVLKQPKRTALLCYLALASRVGFCRRDTVLAMFWPELDAEQARHALRQSLYFLRRSVGPGVLVSRGDDELGVAGGARCDAVEFAVAVDGGRLEEALAFYQGDLLPGFFLSDAPEFERWLEGERSRLREQAVDAARKLAERNHGEGKPAAAAQWARRALELSPSDEGSARQLIVMLDRAGDPASALRAFDAFARGLERDFALSPSDQTRELAERIRGRPANGTPHPPPRERVTGRGPTIAVADELQPRADADGSPAAKSSPRRDRRRIAFGVVAGCLMLALGGIAIARGEGMRWTHRPLDATKLFVSVLENRTGDSTLNPIGAMATDWMIQGLSGSDSIHVVDSRTATVLTGTGGRTVAQLAGASGARFVIAGAFYKEGDSLRFMARLSDATTDRQQWTFTPVVAAVGRPEAALPSLQDQAQTLVAQAAFPLRRGYMLRTRSSPPRYDAYREYVLGVDYLVRREPRSAQQHFLTAARLDTTFTEALLSAVASGSPGAMPPVDSIMQLLARRRGYLSSMSRVWLDGTEAARRRDPSALRDFGELARRYPESFFPVRYGLALLSFHHVREADSVFHSLDPNGDWLRVRFGHWSTLVMLDDLLDDVSAARRDVAAGARAWPHNMGIADADARYLVRAGTPRQRDSLLDEALRLPSVGGYDAATVMGVASSEAAAH